MKRFHMSLVTVLLVGIGLGWIGSLAMGVSGVAPNMVLAQDEPDTTGGGLLVNITTDDTWSASMALSLATTAREQGVEPVIIFLNVRGVYLADKERLPASEGNSDTNMHEKLQAFMAAGGRVIACPSCSREAGLTQEDYIDGVVVGEPGGIIPFVTDPNINVMSY